MNALDILYITLALAVIVTTVFINMILYNIWKMIRSVRESSERALHVTNEILNLKQRVKLSVLRPFYDALNKVRGR